MPLLARHSCNHSNNCGGQKGSETDSETCFFSSRKLRAFKGNQPSTLNILDWSDTKSNNTQKSSGSSCAGKI